MRCSVLLMNGSGGLRHVAILEIIHLSILSKVLKREEYAIENESGHTGETKTGSCYR